jgi:hypothetical protein
VSISRAGLVEKGYDLAIWYAAIPDSNLIIRRNRFDHRTGIEVEPIAGAPISKCSRLATSRATASRVREHHDACVASFGARGPAITGNAGCMQGT